MHGRLAPRQAADPGNEVDRRAGPDEVTRSRFQAPLVADHDRAEVGTADADDGRLGDLDLEPTERHLDRRGIGGVIDDEVGDRESH